MALTTPINTSKVREALSENTNNVGDLCRSDKINKWSKWKPVRYATVTPLTNAIIESVSVNYGLGGLSFVPETDIVATTQTGVPTPIYEKPLGTANSPCRIGDFRNYNHDAVPPIILQMDAFGWDTGTGISNGSSLGTNKIVILEERDYILNRRTGYRVRITQTEGVDSEIKFTDLNDSGISYANSRLTLIIGKAVNNKLGSVYRVYQDSVNIGVRTSVDFLLDTSKLNRGDQMNFTPSDKIIVCACVMPTLGNEPFYENISSTSGTLRLSDENIAIVADTYGVLYQNGIGGTRPTQNINVTIGWSSARASLYPYGGGYQMIMEALSITMSAVANINIVAIFPSTGQSVVVGSFSGNGTMAGGNAISIPLNYISGSNPVSVQFRAVRQNEFDEINIISNTITESYFL